MSQNNKCINANCNFYNDTFENNCEDVDDIIYCTKKESHSQINPSRVNLAKEENVKVTGELRSREDNTKSDDSPVPYTPLDFEGFTLWQREKLKSALEGLRKEEKCVFHNKTRCEHKHQCNGFGKGTINIQDVYKWCPFLKGEGK